MSEKSSSLLRLREAKVKGGKDRGARRSSVQLEWPSRSSLGGLKFVSRHSGHDKC